MGGASGPPGLRSPRPQTNRSSRGGSAAQGEGRRGRRHGSHDAAGWVGGRHRARHRLRPRARRPRGVVAACVASPGRRRGVASHRPRVDERNLRRGRSGHGRRVARRAELPNRQHRPRRRDAVRRRGHGGRRRGGRRRRNAGRRCTAHHAHPVRSSPASAGRPGPGRAASRQGRGTSTSGRPAPGRPTPGRPTPGRPTPGRPTPGRPTPGRFAPAATRAASCSAEPSSGGRPATPTQPHALRDPAPPGHQDDALRDLHRHRGSGHSAPRSRTGAGRRLQRRRRRLRRPDQGRRGRQGGSGLHPR